mgnify:CR=1 FL=1
MLRGSARGIAARLWRVVFRDVVLYECQLKERKNKMMNFNAYVIEFEADNSYKVCIENVYKGVVTDNGLIDDAVTTFEPALSTVIEIMLSYDYDYVQVAHGLTRKGRPYRKYVISVDNGD